MNGPSDLLPLIEIDTLLNNKINCKAVYDSGSNSTLVNERVVKQLCSKFKNSKHVINSLSGKNFTLGRALLKVKIGRIESYITFYIMKKDEFKYDVLLGLDAIKKFKLIQSDDLNIYQRLDMKMIKLNEVKDERNMNFFKNDEEMIERITNLNVTNCEEDHDLTIQQKNQVRKIIDQNIDCFATGKYDVGRTKSSEACVKLISDKIIGNIIN